MKTQNLILIAAIVCLLLGASGNTKDVVVAAIGGEDISGTLDILQDANDLSLQADADGPYEGRVGEPVTFDGTGSSDPNGTIITYEWDFGDGETGTGPTPTHTYSMADIYIVTLTVTSDTGATDSDNAIAVIEPANEPPDCSRAYPSRRKLWPPNHKFKKVRILNVTDPDGDPVNIVIDSIYQDEPVGKKPDARGVGTHIARLRAERIRAKKGNGRVYHINFTAYDDKGASCSGHVTVGVPTNRGKKATMIDDGALFDSTVTK